VGNALRLRRFGKKNAPVSPPPDDGTEPSAAQAPAGIGASR